MKTTKMLATILSVSLFFSLGTGCKKDKEPLPDLSTKALTYVSHNGAICGGTFNSNANQSSAQGICWGTSPDPTISDSHSENMFGSYATGGGSFDIVISNLLPSTTYHVRAYCTNSTGTGYGNDLTFITLAAPPATITDIDGNTYNTVVIGNQVWLKENLNVTHYANGDSISICTDLSTSYSITTEKYGNVNNDPLNAPTYGRLYNYYALSDARKIAPAGWHVPSQEEWDNLIRALGGDNFVMGGKLKEAGTLHWPAPNTGADNSSGFTALPSGNGGNIVGYWSSTIYNDGSNSKVCSHSLRYDEAKLSLWASEKNEFIAIRLVRDYAQ